MGSTIFLFVQLYTQDVSIEMLEVKLDLEAEERRFMYILSLQSKFYYVTLSNDKS